MTLDEQIKQYEYQQTDEGKRICQMLHSLKSQYCSKLGINPNEIKTGTISALTNACTGKIERFIEE